jgi:hypothetical protein
MEPATSRMSKSASRHSLPGTMPRSAWPILLCPARSGLDSTIMGNFTPEPEHPECRHSPRAVPCRPWPPGLDPGGTRRTRGRLAQHRPGLRERAPSPPPHDGSPGHRGLGKRRGAADPIRRGRPRGAAPEARGLGCARSFLRDPIPEGLNPPPLRLPGLPCCLPCGRGRVLPGRAASGSPAWSG